VGVSTRPAGFPHTWSAISCTREAAPLTTRGTYTRRLMSAARRPFRRYVGGWTEEHLKADVDAQTAAAHSCYTVAAIWMGFLALSFVCCFANHSKPSTVPRVRY